MKYTIWVGTAIAALLGVGVMKSFAQPALQVRVQRWLDVRQATGSVMMLENGNLQPAKVGARLAGIGDGIETGSNSTAMLGVDTNVGFVNVSENTSLRIQRLEIAPDNGRVTHLSVTKGQARLRVRPFTHRGSELKIQTPAGFSGVRGTEFGLAIQPNGKTGLAVLDGRVNSNAQGKEIPVAKGFQNFTIPGESPSTPVPLKDDTGLKYEFERVVERGVRKVRLVGQTDPVNSVIVDGTPRDTDRSGRFTADLLPVGTTPALSFQVTVITPLGKQQVYDLVFR
ncbi:FecR family protein [Pantanalinema rosaneae CENA516]|uniref:FecR family protein n=1 Tax=Pantanalinema rosaneae TaxID=1620701 RepID=UPI003D6EA7FD